jgi:glutaredoxin
VVDIVTSPSRLSKEQRGGKERSLSMTEQQPVKIYSLSTCSHCKSTKKLLGDCTVKYEFVDVDLLEGEERKAILEDVKKFNPKCSFPTIIIGDKVIVGYKEHEIKEALGL